jgi:phosphatidate phosphatase LPIN
MKIGDAGEAFFIFETDEDVPDELITSPLLQPTFVGQPGESGDLSTGRFGAAEGEHGVEGHASQSRKEELDVAEDVSPCSNCITR